MLSSHIKEIVARLENCLKMDVFPVILVLSWNEGSHFSSETLFIL